MQRDGVVLSDSQKRGIVQSTSELRAEIARIDALRLELLAQTDINNFLLAPVLQLPHEILSLIFDLALTGVRIHDKNFGEPCLTRVCRVWRTVALSTPQLWTEVNIPTDPEPPSKHAISTYVARSGQLPLHIFVDAYMWQCMTIDEEEWKTAAEVLQYVAQLSMHRWRRLDITGDFLVFARQKELELPRLESVSIAAISWLEHDEEPDADKPQLPLDFLANASNLRDVTLEVAYPNVRLPWQDIPHLTFILRTANDEELGGVVDAVSRHRAELETLAVLRVHGRHYAFAFPPSISSDIQITAPNLVDATFSGLGYTALAPLDAPKLASITMRDIGQQRMRPGPFITLYNVAQRTNLAQTLRRLSLEAIVWQGSLAAVRQCLGALVHLEDLHVAATLFGQVTKEFRETVNELLCPRFLDWLTRADDPLPSEPLPNLTSLTLNFYSACKHDLKEQLIDLVESRKDAIVIEGVTHKALTRFTTDRNFDFHIPAPGL
ncbi:uncharacterized protein SCHCODRAFT_02616952 [Schizophyllum commune H4-8]|nr:uncharacterized protein SCHCODRAFT_02616952 [Schizophyllum commune H4-8]KAI5897230.1 hypothetical protein SCHCODRAFT_02616952 [Schizophyllum commune H4-8]